MYICIHAYMHACVYEWYKNTTWSSNFWTVTFTITNFWRPRNHLTDNESRWLFHAIIINVSNSDCFQGLSVHWLVLQFVLRIHNWYLYLFLSPVTCTHVHLCQRKNWKILLFELKSCMYLYMFKHMFMYFYMYMYIKILYTYNMN